MTLRQTAYGKFHAARVLFQFIKYLINWREVWSAYRNRSPLPPLALRSGYTLHHGPGDEPIGLLQEVMIHGVYRKYLREPLSGTVIDLGANIGASTLDLIAHFPSVQVHAWEPNPETFGRLQRNIEANGLTDRVKLYPRAAARNSGQMQMWISVPSIYATVYRDSLANMPEIGLRPDQARPVMVESNGLDDVIAETGSDRVALLKIDAEGAEADILEGASRETLAKVRQIAIEYHDHLVPGSLSRSRRAMEEAGFTCAVDVYNPTGGLLYGWRD